jgi:hypothetical protein
MLGHHKEVLWMLCPLSGVENMDTSYKLSSQNFKAKIFAILILSNFYAIFLATTRSTSEILHMCA